MRWKTAIESWCWPGWHFEFGCPDLLSNLSCIFGCGQIWEIQLWGLELRRAIRQRPADSLTAGTQWGSIITPLTCQAPKVRCKEKTCCQEHSLCYLLILRPWLQFFPLYFSLSSAWCHAYSFLTSRTCCMCTSNIHFKYFTLHLWE